MFLSTKSSLLSKEDKRNFLDTWTIISVNGKYDGFRVVCVVQNCLQIAEVFEKYDIEHNSF